MRSAKAGGGPGSLSTTNVNGKNGNGGPARGALDGVASALAGETSLSSPDLVQQLLRVARGDLSAVASMDGTISNSETVSHPVTSIRASNIALSEGGGVRRDSLTKPSVSNDGAGVPFAPRPVAASLPPTTESRSACVSTDEEACVFYLTALVAHALHMEDYWVNLQHQVEVDQHVEFIQFCAAAGFDTHKTLHLLHWWKQFRALVRDPAASHALQLCDGNPQGPSSSAGPPEAAYTSPTSTAGGGDFHASNTHTTAAAATATPAATTGGSAKGASKKGVRGSATGTTNSTSPAADTDTSAAAAAASSAGAVPAFASSGGVYPSHEDAVRTELQRFVQWELEHEYEWRLVPREPFAASGAAGILTPMGAGGGARGGTGLAGAAGGAAGAAAGGAAASASSFAPAGGKSSKADKAKLQLQQQQELEWEEQRLARIAALPADNIFLTKAEADQFVRVAVTEGLAAHAALHAYVATEAGQPLCTLTHAAAAPVFFSVQVEVPMPVLPLRDAIRPSAQPAAASLPISPRLSGDVVAAANNGVRSPLKAPVRPASSTQTKPRSRVNSKNASSNATTSTTTSAAGAAAAPNVADTTTAAEELPSATTLRPAVVATALEELRAEQAKEAAAYRAAYAEELANAAAQETQQQHAADVTLFFEKSSTQTAVQAVYESMEDAVAARQQRILQRVTALEQALGLAEGSGAAEGD